MTFHTPEGYNERMTELLSRPMFWVSTIILFASATAFVVFAWPRQAEAGALSNVSVQDLHAAAGQGALVLDVREPHEFAEGRVPGSLLVPLASVPSRADEFAKDEPVYIVCRSGNRSLVAAEGLVAAGYSDVRNVQGGMIAWEGAGLPIER